MNLEAHLMKNGYHQTDAKDVVSAYHRNGMPGVEEFAKEWAPRDEPLYAEELIGVVKTYFKYHKENK
jgi:hypothetical protein